MNQMQQIKAIDAVKVFSFRFYGKGSMGTECIVETLLRVWSHTLCKCWEVHACRTCLRLGRRRAPPRWSRPRCSRRRRRWRRSSRQEEEHSKILPLIFSANTVHNNFFSQHCRDLEQIWEYGWIRWSGRSRRWGTRGRRSWSRPPARSGWAGSGLWTWLLNVHTFWNMVLE